MNLASKILAILLIISISLNSCNSDNDKPYAVNGVLNLSDYQINEQIIKLDGEWEFFWNQLISPNDFKKLRVVDQSYAAIPSTWYQLKKAHPSISAHGTATYRLNIYKQSDNSSFGIKFNRINVAYKVWIDGNCYARLEKLLQIKRKLFLQKNQKHITLKQHQIK